MIYKNDTEIRKTISYRLQLIDSARCIASILWNLLIILLKKSIKLNANMDMIIKSQQSVELNINTVNIDLNTEILKMIQYHAIVYIATQAS